MRKYLMVFYTAIIFLSTNFIFSEDKHVVVSVPNSIYKGNTQGGSVNFTIALDSDGIISSVMQNSKEKPLCSVQKLDSNSELIITINSTNEKVNLYKIKFDEDKLIISGPRFSTKDRQFYEVLINPTPSVIYSSQDISLEHDEKFSLYEKFTNKPGNGFAYTFTGLVLVVDYRTNGNVNYKYFFEKTNNSILATYYYPMEIGEKEVFSNDSPVFAVTGAKLYNKDMKKNVLNYFILKIVNNLNVTSTVFPLIFLSEIR